MLYVSGTKGFTRHPPHGSLVEDCPHEKDHQAKDKLRVASTRTASLRPRLGPSFPEPATYLQETGLSLPSREAHSSSFRMLHETSFAHHFVPTRHVIKKSAHSTNDHIIGAGGNTEFAQEPAVSVVGERKRRHPRHTGNGSASTGTTTGS